MKPLCNTKWLIKKPYFFWYKGTVEIYLNIITSAIKMSDCFNTSPIIKTVDVVPSPVQSSWAVDVLAINDAVGCWICCKKKKR